MAQYPSSYITDITSLTHEEFSKTFVELLADSDHYWARKMYGEQVVSGGLGKQVIANVGYHGSLRTHAPYKSQSASQVSNHAVKWYVPHRCQVFDIASDVMESELNNGMEAIVDVLHMRASAAIKQKFKDAENLYLGKPLSSTDQETPHGLEYHLRMYCNSSGVPQAVPNGVPDRLGNYLTPWSDASTTDIGKYFEVDLTAASNADIRNCVMDYTGELNDDFRSRFRHLRRIVGVQTLPGLHGKAMAAPNSPYEFVISRTFGELMEGEAHNGPDNWEGDAGGRFTNYIFQGITPVESTKLDDDTYDRLYLVRSSNFKNIAPKTGEMNTTIQSQTSPTTKVDWYRRYWNLALDGTPYDGGAVIYVV